MQRVASTLTSVVSRLTEGLVHGCSPSGAGGVHAGELVVAFGGERLAVAVDDVYIDVVAVVEGGEDIIVAKVFFAVVHHGFHGLASRAKHDFPDDTAGYGSSLKEAELCLYLLGLIKQHLV